MPIGAVLRLDYCLSLVRVLSNSTATVVLYELSRPAADFRRNLGRSPTERCVFGVLHAARLHVLTPAGRASGWRGGYGASLQRQPDNHPRAG